MNRTNYFGRFENKSADAEDRLTRAFLVLVRLIPSVQAAVIDAIREGQHERGTHHVVPSRTKTEVGVGGVWSQSGDLHVDEGHVLSILLIGDDWDQDVEVRPSDRSPVYDGVVHFHAAGAKPSSSRRATFSLYHGGSEVFRGERGSQPWANIDAVRIRSTTFGTIWYGRAKYRYHVLTGEVARRVRELVRQKCKALDVRIVKGHVSKDHVHILVSCPTTISPAKLTGADQGSIFPQGAGGVCPLEEAILGTAFLGTGVFLCDGRSCDG